MPMYTWLCNSCQTKTDVLRSISDIDNKPDDGCEACKGTDLKRVIAEWRREQTMKIWGGKVAWHDEAYNSRGPVRDK